MNKNHEIITQAASQKNFIYNGNNLHTYGEWLQLGYVPTKGQRAFIKTRLWSTGINKRLKSVALFRDDQVVKITPKTSKRKLVLC
jgi:hypothetical protein